MDPIILTSVLEILLLLAGVGGMLFIKWRQKRRRDTDFELLLDDIKSRQSSRANALYARLLDGFQQDRARTLSERLIEAEKIFLQQFVELQMQQSSVAGFYEQLCKLLDNYLLIQNVEIGKAEDESSIRESVQTYSESAAEELEGRVATVESPPAWGDVFD